jgi:hypothetical protein
MSADAPAPPSVSLGPTSRRRALALLGAGGAAGLATLLSGGEARAGHDGSNVFHLGVDNSNPPGTSTSLSGSGPTTLGGPATLELFGGLNVAGGSFLTSNAGHTLRILRGDPDDSDSALIVSTAGEGPAVEAIGALNGLSGVSSNEANADGGPTGSGIGVGGGSGSGVGTQGISKTGFGVQAHSPDGFALLVQGTAALSTVGSAVVPRGDNSVFVSNPAVSADSHVSVTVASDPGERHVSWVERDPGSGFEVHMSEAPRRKRPETSLTYLIVDPVPDTAPDPPSFPGP